MTVVIRGLHLFGNKRFKVFLEGQMSEDKPTLLLAIEINFFLCSIYSLQV